MPAYVIANIDVPDPEGSEGSKALSTESASRYGGRFVARGGATVVLEGDWAPKRLVVLEFADLDAVRRWYDSPEYREARAIRERTASTQMVVTVA